MKYYKEDIYYSDYKNNRPANDISDPLIVSYIIGRSRLFFAEYGVASVYSTQPIAYDTQQNTLFNVAHRKDENDESVVIGGIAACIKQDGANLPMFKKYSEHYKAVKTIEELACKHKTAEIYGAWRNPDFGGLGITEKLYRDTYSSLQKSNVEVVVATLTPKNVDGYLRQAKASEDKFTTFVATGVNIQIINTEGESKPRLAIVSTSNQVIIEKLLKNENFSLVDTYIKNYEELQVKLSNENEGKKLKPAALIEMLTSKVAKKHNPFKFVEPIEQSSR